MLRIDGFDVFVELEDLNGANDDSATEKSDGQTASCRVEPVTGSSPDQLRTIDIDELDNGDIILERASKSAAVRFILQGVRTRHAVELRWG